MRKALTVADLKEGETGLIEKVEGLNHSCILFTMGIHPKMKVTMVRKSPFGDAFYIKLDDYAIALRREEGLAIYLEEIPA